MRLTESRVLPRDGTDHHGLYVPPAKPNTDDERRKVAAHVMEHAQGDDARMLLRMLGVEDG